MSANSPPKRLTIPGVTARKGGKPLVCLTAYTTPIAQIADRYCDIVLVGDSVGMVLHGMPNTVGVTLEMMILHGKAVRRGIANAILVVDMPFGTYEGGSLMAFENASRLMKETGCSAVKLEGGVRIAETVRFLVDRGIPVMGHVGLTPQSVNALGGYGTQGIASDAERVRKDAIALQEAGAFSVVLEKITVEAADDITSELVIPTIGIGASQKCDGQILVTEDLLGAYNRFTPKFIKRYADLDAIVSGAIASYASEVVDRVFPSKYNVFRDPTLQKEG